MSRLRLRAAILRGGGACLVIAEGAPSQWHDQSVGTPPQPLVVHWGADLGEDCDIDALLTCATPPIPHSTYSIDTPRRVVARRGWVARPPYTARLASRRQRMVAAADHPELAGRRQLVEADFGR